MTFFKNTEFLKVLSFFMICTLLTAGLAPITRAASKVHSGHNEQMNVYGYAYASVSYTGTDIESSHYVSCSNSEEGTSVSCTAKYNLSATQIIGQFEMSIINPKDDADSGEAVAPDPANGNDDSQCYYDSSALSAAADLDADNKYRLTAYTRLKVKGNGGSTQWDAIAVEKWGDW